MTDAFDHFRSVMQGPLAPQRGIEIAELLEAQARQACTDFGLINAEIFCGGDLVTMLLTERDAWEAVVVGPDSYQLYPGALSTDGDEIIWPNIWVADNYDLDKFIAALEDAFEQAARPPN